MMENLPESKRDFAISDILNEAWGLVSGSKGPIWAIAIFIGIASLIIQFIIVELFRIDPETASAHYRFLFMPLINSIVIAPFFAGTVMTAIKRARGESISPKSGFLYFHKTWQVIVGMFIITFLAIILNYIFHLSPIATAVGRSAVWLDIIASIVSILVYVFTLLAIPLIVDKNYGPWEGLIASFRIIKHCWFKVLILIIIIYVFFIIATLPLIIGSMIHPYAKFLGVVIFVVLLIWLLPYVFLIQGVLYHKLVD